MSSALDNALEESSPLPRNSCDETNNFGGALSPTRASLAPESLGEEFSRSSFGKKYLPSPGRELVPLTANFYLLPELGPSVLHGGRLGIKFLEWGVKQCLDEQESTPLFVGEPYNNRDFTREGLNFLRELGFIMTRAKGNTYILQATPPWCEGVQLTIFFLPLVDWVEGKKECSLPDLLGHLAKVDFKLTGDIVLASLWKIVGHFSPKELEKENIITPVKDKQFDYFFER